MRNIKLIIEYQGTNYAGWQIQENLPTIQGTIQEKLKIITGAWANGSSPMLTASSRTDAGVHALGQTANFFTESSIPAHSFQSALNALLPDDIVISYVEDVPLDFDSRRNAKAKTYRYFVLNRPYPSAIYKNFCWHIFKKLDIDAMREAANFLIGKKDFTSFRAAECDALHSVREILSFSIKTEKQAGGLSLQPSAFCPLPVFCDGRAEEGFIELEVKGTAFLRHMVRIMVGTLIAVGKGKIAPDQIESIIHARDRRFAGMTAPAQGLFLKEVEY